MNRVSCVGDVVYTAYTPGPSACLWTIVDKVDITGPNKRTVANFALAGTKYMLEHVGDCHRVFLLPFGATRCCATAFD